MPRDVFGCYLTDGESVSHSFMRSVVSLLAADDHLIDGGLRCRRTGPGDIANGRNELTAMWLDQTEAPWMWMIDTDMGFPPDTLSALIASANTVNAGAMGALCFSWRADVPDGYGGFVAKATPTMFDWDGQGFRVSCTYPRNEAVLTSATGAACLLIHRSTAETIRREYGPEWWNPVRYPDGRFLGEDLSFCWRMRMLGIPLFVDTGIRTTHAKTAWIGEGDFLRDFLPH